MREIRVKNEDFAGLSMQIFAREGFLCFKARGSSMYPFIRDGDLLTVKGTETGHLRTGDVVVCSPSEGSLVAHRIIGKSSQDNTTVLQVRGDSVFGFDQKVSADRILGQVVSVCRGKRTFRIAHGLWKIAAYLWIRSYPLGPLFLHSAKTVKRSVTSLVRRMRNPHSPDMRAKDARERRGYADKET